MESSLEDVLEKYHFLKRNDNGARFVALGAKASSLMMMREREINHISISNRFKNGLLNVRNGGCADIDLKGDHHLMVACLHFGFSPKFSRRHWQFRPPNVVSVVTKWNDVPTNAALLVVESLDDLVRDVGVRLLIHDDEHDKEWRKHFAILPV